MSVRAAFESLVSRIERTSWPILLIISILFFRVTLPIAAVRLFWYDEVFTVLLSRSASIGDLWHKLTMGFDMQPPVQFIATMFSRSAFGENGWAIRLPESIGFWLMCVCLFFFVRRRTSTLFGAVAALLPMVTGAYPYAYEARPYALMLGFSSLALLSWQYSSETRHRRLAIIGLSAGLVLAVSSHYYAVFAAVPLFLGEAVRIYERKRLDYAVAAALLVSPLAPIIAFLPFLRSATAQTNIKVNWGTIHLGSVIEPYTEFLQYAAVPLCVGITFVILLRYTGWSGNKETGHCLPTAELAASLGFLGLPFIAVPCAIPVLNMFAARYVVSLVIGFAILFACGAYEASRGGKLAGVGLAVILAGWFVHWNTPLPQNIRDAPIQFSKLTLPKDARIDGLRLLIANPHDAVACFYSCPEEVRSRATYAADPDLALRYAGIDIADASILAAGKLYSLPVMHWRDFSKGNRQFLLLWQKGQFEWILKHLQAVSAHVEILSSTGAALVLFVTLPE